jgi:hypothetical protein
MSVQALKEAPKVEQQQPANAGVNGQSNASAGMGNAVSSIMSAASVDQKDDSLVVESKVKGVVNRFLQLQTSQKNIKFAGAVNVDEWITNDRIRITRDEQTKKDNTFLCVNLDKQGVQARVQFVLDGPMREPDPNDQGQCSVQ